MIDAGVKIMADCEKDNSLCHFVYCETKNCEEDLKEMILAAMKKYGIQSSILTILQMEKRLLMTKEKAKKAAEEQLKNDPDHTEWKYYEGSINDDLETFLHNLLNQEEIKEEVVFTFFLPKLTYKELKLVEEKNKDYMATFSFGMKADVDVEEMKLSDSKDKYVKTFCWRRTFKLSPEANQSLFEESASDDLSEISGFDLSEIISDPFYAEKLVEAEALAAAEDEALIEAESDVDYKKKCCCHM